MPDALALRLVSGLIGGASLTPRKGDPGVRLPGGWSHTACT